ncbi:P-II family nitrogen regulator [Lutibacter sp. B1]|uniref:P-II family nitrogen regulator n=1 Tax=Lutibacter sp. B1 TaxID=2725996 RepID=UPI0014566CA9|nr:P-II family nitrogen regulator [Lutibacter sp. B1]NLP59213.1 P-II family nitrogen regulator [Lutibacter sp. B1]
MKEIKAFIKPNRIQRVIEALSDNGFESMTLSQAEGTGAFKAKGARPSLDFHITDSRVVKIELVCQNEEAQAAIEIILANGKTEEPADGDGIIYLSDIEDAFQIKTGDSLKRHDL